MTADGDEVDLTGGLRVIQYFAYVGGLVKLAYEIMCERQGGDDEASAALGEQYPLVLDAAFSHADSALTSHNKWKMAKIVTDNITCWYKQD